jgi:hypothetical protein
MNIFLYRIKKMLYLCIHELKFKDKEMVRFFSNDCKLNRVSDWFGTVLETERPNQVSYQIAVNYFSCLRLFFLLRQTSAACESHPQRSGQTVPSRESLSPTLGQTFATCESLSPIPGQTFATCESLSPIPGQTFATCESLSPIPGQTFAT